MAFGKKKSTVKFDQSNVSLLASEALAKSRANIVLLAFRVTGETPLLMHRWGQKAIMQMVGKMVGLDQPRDPKDLTGEYEASYYRNTRKQVCVPCRIVKAAIIEGAISTGGVTSKAELKRGLRVLGYTAPLRMDGGPMRMDCRIASNNGSPDMRARALVPEGWSFDVVLQFSTVLSPDKVVAAFEGAGATIGLCDNRPERGGDYGTFRISLLSDKDIQRIEKENAIPEEEYVIPPEFLRPFKIAADSTSDTTRKAMAVAKKVNGDARASRGVS